MRCVCVLCAQAKGQPGASQVLCGDEGGHWRSSRAGERTQKQMHTLTLSLSTTTDMFTTSKTDCAV